MINDCYFRVVSISGFFPLTEQNSVLQEALSIALTIDDAFAPPTRLAELASRLAKLPQIELYELWCETLDAVSHQVTCLGGTKNNENGTRMTRISGPLMDRIDIHLEVQRVPYQKLEAAGTGEPSTVIRTRVAAAL